MKNLRYRIEYSLVWVVDAFFFLFPRSIALKIGEMMGLFFYFVLASRTRLALANLAAAFPEKNEVERRRIVRTMWQGLGRAAVEFVRVTEINRDNYNDYFILDGQENLEKVKKMDKGLVLVTMHFTSWEMMAAGTAYLFGGAAIARPMKNPYVENWVKSKRAGGGVPIILHRQAVRASLKILKEKKTVGVLVDQNLYTGGVFINFFGRPVASTTLPALLHDRTEAPVIICYCLREGKKFRLVYEPPIKFPEISNMEERIFAHTQLISDQLERVVRAHPESWFWVHNRWKRTQEA